ncbi:methylmalonyl-CoA mutase [Chloroflexota bacterium]
MFDEVISKQMGDSLQKWEEEKDDEFKKERKAEFTSESGIEIKRLYTPLDIEDKGIDYFQDIGFPGAYPFTRGVTATGYRGQLWGIRQYAGHPTPEASNKLWKAQVAAGSQHVRIAYDLPSQLGCDPDNPRAEGEVGRVGVSMSSLKDLEIALRDIDLNVIHVGQVHNALAVVGLANHICLANQRGLKLADIRGELQNDILKEYQARGCYVFPPAPSLRLSTDVATYCGEHMPLYSGMEICTYHHSECGATPVHEAAIGLANCIAYFDTIMARGIEIDTVAPTVRFIVAIDHRSFFEHIAKIRAMRRIYAKTLKERFGAKRPESMAFRNYSGKRGQTMYREQYLNNIARSAIGGMAAALAGSQWMGLRCYDEAFGIPSEEAQLTGGRVQQIIAYETGITDTVDPLAGSYFFEWLTKEMEERIYEELERIDKLGGALRCTETGYFRRLMVQDAYEWQRGVESKETVIVGVNYFRSHGEEERPARVYRADPTVEAERVEAIRTLKAKRDNRAARRALDDVKAVASETGPRASSMVPPVIEAAKSYCTVGEICDSLREHWGEHKEFKLPL